MVLVNSLVTAIVRTDGDALVLHVGERPYVVTAKGNVDLSNTILTLDSVSSMLAQLLPIELLTHLSEVGAVEHQLQPPSTMRDAFTVVAARGGDDIWIEVRRKRAVVTAAPGVPGAGVPGVPGVPGVLGVPGVPEVPEVARVPGVPEVPEVARVPEVPEASEVRQSAVSREPNADNVIPLTRAVRVSLPPRQAASDDKSVERLLGIAAARGASVLYLTSQSRPFLRVEGEMRAIDGEAPLTTADIEAIVFGLMPESARDAYGRGEPAEWMSELEGLGRIRCGTFRDHRGPGVLFHFISTRPISADQLGLTREIQSLATESDGLVVVAGPRGGGKSTLVAALVDLINRQHSGSVITIERQIRIVHENRLALVSQREVRGTEVDAVAVVRAALRENPDVLVLEDLKAPEVVQLAVEAAGSGLLVFLTVTAGSALGALVRVVDAFGPDARKGAQATLAERLRGAVSQVVLRKAGGGRIAARELLLASPAVASLIAEGQFGQLGVAIDSGRKHGMVSLNDVLLALVKSGTVDVSEAYRKADNRAALLALLKRDGIDTSLLERLA
jgi:twitching motility protein PilT